MQTTLAPWTGDAFPMPVPPPASAPPPAPVGKFRRWSIRIGRAGLSISSTVEDYRPRVVAPVMERRTGAAMLVAAVAGGLALLLVGASAGRAWSPEPQRTEAAMIIPTAKPVPAPAPAVRVAREPRHSVGRAVPANPTPETPDYIATISRSEAIERALGTGEFQEWSARDGTTGFAVAGPAETTPQGNCRALAVLTRKIDGSDSVASSRECRATSETAAR